MVFPSAPLYLDPPNWQQQPNRIQQQIQGHHEQNQHFLITPPPQQQQQQKQLEIGGSIGPGPVAQQNRANSMSERARLAKIPPPEVPQKCPRCDSTNTKFCYYNNYSLSQPRHFCKTCRRYWTRGGALRNVPVGGGCRRNKRSSSSSHDHKASSVGNGATSTKSTLSSSSQSTLLAGDQAHLRTDSRGINVNSLSGIGNSMSFMTSLQNIAQLGGMSNMGLASFNSQDTPLGITGGGYQHYNLDQFPQYQVQFPNFLGGFEIPGASGGGGGSGLFSSTFQNVIRNSDVIGGDNEDDQEQLRRQMNVHSIIMGKSSSSSSSIVSQVKMEENGQQGIGLAKKLMTGISPSNDNNNITENGTNNSDHQFWDGSNNNTTGNNNSNNNPPGVTSMWTDLSGLHTSSTNHLL